MNVAVGMETMPVNRSAQRRSGALQRRARDH